MLTSEPGNSESIEHRMGKEEGKIAEDWAGKLDRLRSDNQGP